MAIDMDAIIAAVQAAQLLKDKDLKAAPQSFDPLLGKFVPLLSDNGAARHVLYDANGNPLSIVDNKLAVRAAEAETAISALAAALKGANDKTLSDIATTLSSQSTAEKQEALANLVGALDAEVVSDPAAAGAVIALLKGLLSRLQTLENKIDSFTTGEETVNTELKGSLVQNAFEIIPSDAADLTHETIAIYVGFDGDLKIDLVNGETITMYNLAAGAWHPIAAKKVYATGTTATYILGAYLI